MNTNTALLASLFALLLLGCNKSEQPASQQENKSGESPAIVAASLSLQSETKTAFVGDQFYLNATVIPRDAAVTWSSSRKSVATVNEEGYVSAIGPGTTFITARSGEKSASCELTVTCITNLSAAGTANCYLVPEAGYYSFDMKKGNSDEWLEGVTSAEVLWESFGTANSPAVGDLLSIRSFTKNTLTFSTHTPLNNGNAVIAVKDECGDILWSWHIWLCQDYDPVSKGHVYYNNAGTMMDRNLGATSARPGNVHSLGLFYQWGRKDPLLGSSSISSSLKAASTGSWPTPVVSDASTGTIDYAIKHPTTFISRNKANSDWFYTGDETTDQTRWSNEKSQYDPCPPGWQLPYGGSNGIWSIACGTYSYVSDYPFDNTNKGMDFSGKLGSSAPTWYPATGYLYFNEHAQPMSVGTEGNYWSSTPMQNHYVAYAFRIVLSNSGTVFSPNYNAPRAHGYAVRCLKSR